MKTGKRRWITAGLILALAISALAPVGAETRVDLTEELHRVIEERNGRRTKDGRFFSGGYTDAGEAVLSAALPESYLAPYTSIKQQGIFGSCWTFSAINSLESAYLMRHSYSGGLAASDPIDWAEAQIAYAAMHGETEENIPEEDGGTLKEDSWNDYSLIGEDSFYGYDFGGNLYLAASTLAKGVGVIDEDEVPYRHGFGGDDKKEEAAHAMAEDAAKHYRDSHLRLDRAYILPELYENNWDEIAGFSRTPHLENMALWKSVMIENGALWSSCYMDPDDASYYHTMKELSPDEYMYSENYWTYDANAMTGNPDWFAISNHSISFVGYDDAYSRYHFAVPLKNGKNERYYDGGAGEVVYLPVKADGTPDVAMDINGHAASDPASHEPKTGYRPFIVPKGDGAWIVKNSWGDEYGDNGILYLTYYEETINGGMMLLPEEGEYTAGEDNNTYHEFYQYDGISPERLSVSNPDADFYGANVFTAREDTILSEVGFWTLEPDTDVTVRIYTGLTDPTDPESGTLCTTFTATEIHRGYYSEALPDPVLVKKGERFSAVISLKTATGCYIPLEMDSLTDPIYHLVCKRGESFIYNAGFTDCMDEAKSLEETYGQTIGNVAVKLMGEVAGLKISDDALHLSVGGSAVINVASESGTPVTVTWKSDKPAVASVAADGTVVAVKPGTATITATAEDGKSATCKVTVTGSYLPGDMNDDHNLNAKDITALRRSIASGYGVTIDFERADVNCDNNLNAKDITMLRRYIAGGYGVEL